MPYVYAEEILLTGWVMNFLILRVSMRLLCIRGGVFRSILAAGLAAAAALWLLMMQTGTVLLSLSRLAFAPAMALLVVGGRQWKQLLHVSVAMWLVAVACGGACVCTAFFCGAKSAYALSSGLWISNTAGYMAALGTALALGLFAWLRGRIAAIRVHKQCAQLRFCICGRTYTCMAFQDTGHSLREPVTHLAVIVVQADVLADLVQTKPHYCAVSFLQQATAMGLEAKVGLVPFRTVGAEGMLAGIRPEWITWDGKAIDAWVAIFSGTLDAQNRYQALVPLEFEEKV